MSNLQPTHPNQYGVHDPGN